MSGSPFNKCWVMPHNQHTFRQDDKMVTGLHSDSITQSVVQLGRWLIPPILIIIILNINGCTSIISSASNRLADNVTKGLLSQDDPDIARLGTPAYLVLIDGFIESDPSDASMLTAGAEPIGMNLSSPAIASRNPSPSSTVPVCPSFWYCYYRYSSSLTGQD
jgi:hypothetical protein